MENAGYEPIGGTLSSQNSVGDTISQRQGQNGIDGIYRNDDGEYVIVETKASSTNRTCGLENTNHGRQMSEQWLRLNLTPESTGLSDDEIDQILWGIRSGNTRLVQADVTGVNPGGSGQPPSPGTLTFNNLEHVGRDNVRKNGTPWTP